MDLLGHIVRCLVIVGGGQSQSFEGPSLVARGYQCLTPPKATTLYELEI